MLEFCYADCIPPNQGFYLGSSECATLDPNHSWRKTALPRKLNEIGVRRYDCEAVLNGVLPYGGVRRKSDETGLKNVRETREQILKPTHEPWREIRVEQ